ncbi:lysosomal alpha-mannosidase-like [Anabrus simplex]|uniref:lysosomal alpha-mannosidase-like n=1 Tax=Anabrus simplex TaxID=316456 RepID=UPI0035A3C127
MLFLTLLLLLAIGSGSAGSIKDEEEDTITTCGYEACPRTEPGLLNVHLVPHSHDDVGWLKTVDQYYYGTESYIQEAGVKLILNSVVNELWKNPERRFVQVETAFLWKWWQELSERRRNQVRQLVNSGRFEIIGGAWSMNDEAVTHYQSVIDQFTWGFRKLDEMFGNCSRPRVAWQIDPFGHSREMASIFSQLGFDGLFFARLDFKDKKRRLKTRTSEFIWKGSPNNLGDRANLFTSILYKLYSSPSGFCFDVLCNDETINDNKRSGDYNVPEKVQDFINFCEEQSRYYRTDNILVTMGNDFSYQDARKNFKNMDKLIKYVNGKQKEGSRVNVFYSTPSCYVKAVNDADLKWTVKVDDFFPYASSSHSYWTGYFSSRPTSKYFERQGNNYLQVCKQLSALAGLDETGLEFLREAMGVMQHHDAITGTEKQEVADDYHLMLHGGIKVCEAVIEEAVSKLSAPYPQMAARPQELDSCLLLNVSQCTVSERSAIFVVTVYNPLSHPVNHYVRLPVLGSSYTVLDPSGEEQVVQMVPLHPAILTLPERTSKATMELVFRAEDLPPLGFRSYYIKRENEIADVETKNVVQKSTKKKRNTKKNRKNVAEMREEGNVIGNERIQVELDDSTGMITAVVNEGVRIPATQDFLYYEANDGYNMVEDHRASGAYVFRPADNEPISITSNTNVTFTIYKGVLVEEVHQQISSWVSQIMRIYKEENHVEFDWIVGPLPTDDGVGKEVISRFRSELATHGVFYTDANGREMMKRRLNYRPTWSVQLEEPVAGNYYPVTTRIMIRDESKSMELAVLNDRAQGGSSLHDGELELMVHRRLLYDDGFGVGEALDEIAFGKGVVARGTHWLMAGSKKENGVTLSAESRELVQRKHLSPRVFLSTVQDDSFEQWKNSHTMEFSGMKEALPNNVQILTLEPWKDGTLLLRLEHILEKGEDPQLSKPVTVDLQELFTPFSLLSAEEMSLGVNQPLSEVHRLSWRTEHPKKRKHLNLRRSSAKDSSVVTLGPMQIRTFVIRVKW